jgi:Uma2 family endonuclease
MQTEPTTARQPFVVRVPRSVKISSKQFWEFCQANRDWRCERSTEGDIVIMPPTGGETGAINARLLKQLIDWADRDGTGVVFDSSTGFELPNGATRSPDASWVVRNRLAALTRHQKQRFLPLCPDFVIELKSPTDPFPLLDAKPREYVDNGARLGWLIDPEARVVHVYRRDASVEKLDAPATISGGSVLRGFVLDLGPIWDPGL